MFNTFGGERVGSLFKETNYNIYCSKERIPLQNKGESWNW